MDMMPMLVIVPIILPCATALGIDPLQLGVIFVIACEIGGITPPAAQLLFLTSGMFDVPAEKLIPVVFPFVVVMGICMVFAILFPEISCWLPGTIM